MRRLSGQDDGAAEVGVEETPCSKEERATQRLHLRILTRKTRVVQWLFGGRSGAPGAPPNPGMPPEPTASTMPRLRPKEPLWRPGEAVKRVEHS